ncbi:HsdS Restriction endonuclease S subunits [Paracoccaceae bacterium]
MEGLGFRPYEAYRDCNGDWIDSVPTSWGIKRLKHLARQVSDTISSKETSTRYIGMENVESWSGRLIGDSAEVEGLAASFSPGDVIFGKLRPYLAKAALLDFSGICSTEFLVFRSGNEIEPKFLAYLLRCPDFVNYVDSSTYGSKMPRANPSFVTNACLPFPKIPEQRAIVAFLDEKCAKADEAVKIKEDQIALLRERRQIIIQDAVTRGLNPAAPMKDSGIDWIGQIPAHWDVRRNFTLFRESKRSGNANLPVLSVSIHSGVSTEELSEEENIRSAIKIEDRTSYKEVLPGFVAYNMMRAWQGGIGSVSVHGMVSPAYVVAEPIAEIDATYFELLYRTPVYIWQMDAASKGITDFRKRLYWDDFRNLVTILSPIAEQREIIQSIEAMMAKINSGIAIKERQIAALKEYKTSLINAAVTGKIKVI